MSHDDLDHIPSIVPTREGVPQRSTRRTSTERRRSPGGQTQAPPSGGGSGVFVYLIAGLALIAAGLAFAWAWQLQNQFEQATNQLQDCIYKTDD